MSAAKRTAFDWIAARQGWLSERHVEVWNFHEPAWREYRSAAWYIKLLREQGFKVEEGTAGMPTAFCARLGTGQPVIATYAEYDAVPGNSQDPVPYEKPRDGVHKYAAGHTDPHSALGLGALAGLLATKAALEKHDLAGTLVLFGEPAEKVCGSKPVHAVHGFYDDLDAAISFHPAFTTAHANTVNWDTHCGSYWSRMYSFECPHPEQWSGMGLNEGASAHTTARAPGAIDAVCLMYTTGKMIKEALLPHTGTWTINEAILAAGQATADNLPPTFSQIQYASRAPTLEMQERIYAVLDNNADQVAKITHCTVRKEWVTKTRPGLPNHAISALTFANLMLGGAPQWGDEARRFGRDIQKNLGLEPMREPMHKAMQELVTPEEDEARMRALLPPWQKNYTSDDYTEYTWHCPTARLYVGRAMLAPPRAGFQYPNWVWNALGGYPATIDPTIFSAARAIAGTLVDLLINPLALEEAKAEFRERTGGGIGGTRWTAPLLPTDFAAPIHYRWPEYITTARGTEWWIPRGA
ncbi:MAG: amidohydrolase [Hyphomicrobiales bacterium]|nr:amidohydrolase [Hyphomicrobiales bacterium]